VHDTVCRYTELFSDHSIVRHMIVQPNVTYRTALTPVTLRDLQEGHFSYLERSSIPRLGQLNAARVGTITFKLHFNYRLQITFLESNSNTILDYFGYGAQNTKQKLTFVESNLNTN